MRVYSFDLWNKTKVFFKITNIYIYLFIYMFIMRWKKQLNWVFQSRAAFIFISSYRMVAKTGLGKSWSSKLNWNTLFLFSFFRFAAHPFHTKVCGSRINKESWFIYIYILLKFLFKKFKRKKKFNNTIRQGTCIGISYFILIRLCVYTYIKASLCEQNWIAIHTLSIMETSCFG